MDKRDFNMKKLLTKLLIKLKLLDDSYVLSEIAKSYKIFYLHVIDKENVEDIIVSGDDKICTPDDLAAFILYNLSVNNSNDILASLEENEDSGLDGQKVVESYIKMSDDHLKNILSSLAVENKTKKEVYKPEDPVISPLDIYNNAKVLK